MATCSTSSRMALASPSSARTATARPVVPVRVARRAAVRVAAQQGSSPPKPPAGVSEPPPKPEMPNPRFGFVDWAEKINSRAAMLGFFGILAVEAIAGKGVLEMVGFRVGSGLGFEL